MTIDEAVYCMESYLPGGRFSCQDCKYYGSRDDGDGVKVCQSSTAHEMAIKALYWMKRINGEKRYYID